LQGYGITLFVLPPGSPISVEWWNGATGPSGKFSLSSEDEVDLETVRFHRTRPHWSVRKRSLGRS